MIRANYFQEGNSHSLTVLGHAGYNDNGRDIVCAGVSAVTYSLVGWLVNHEKDTSYLYKFMRSGFTTIICEGNEAVNTAFEVAVIGLAQIAKQYPDYMTMEYKSR